MATAPFSDRNADIVSAQARHADLMQQGFMRLGSTPKLTAAQKKAGKEQSARILARLDAGNSRRAALKIGGAL